MSHIAASATWSNLPETIWIMSSRLVRSIDLVPGRPEETDHGSGLGLFSTAVRPALHPYRVNDKQGCRQTFFGLGFFASFETVLSHAAGQP